MSKKILELTLPSCVNVTVNNVTDLRTDKDTIEEQPNKLTIDKVVQAESDPESGLSKEEYTRIALSGRNCEVIIDLSAEDCETIVDWIRQANNKY